MTMRDYHNSHVDIYNKGFSTSGFMLATATTSKPIQSFKAWMEPTKSTNLLISKAAKDDKKTIVTTTTVLFPGRLEGVSVTVEQRIPISGRTLRWWWSGRAHRFRTFPSLFLTATKEGRWLLRKETQSRKPIDTNFCSVSLPLMSMQSKLTLDVINFSTLDFRESDRARWKSQRSIFSAQRERDKSLMRKCRRLELMMFWHLDAPVVQSQLRHDCGHTRLL